MVRYSGLPIRVVVVVPIVMVITMMIVPAVMRTYLDHNLRFYWG
jgi:hypothetical protein